MGTPDQVRMPIGIANGKFWDSSGGKGWAKVSWKAKVSSGSIRPTEPLPNVIDCSTIFSNLEWPSIRKSLANLP